ncbi:MAG TPA: DNA primase [Pirellulales bacterium]
MSLGFSADAKEQVRQATDIVDLIGSYLPLRREGRGYKALCPWHNDSRPSLQVNPERQSFRCFVCDIGGDAFSFVMRHDGLTFPEALALLAERAGITLKSSGGPPGGADEKRLLYQAMAWVEQQYHECLLRAPEAEPARAYLNSRGIAPESIGRYHLGYAPDRWEWLVGHARDTRFTPKVLEKIGVVGARQSGGGYYDRFKGRVLFSIRDIQGRPVGLGGRVLPGSDDGATKDRVAKYINSPETPLFAKSSLLYALDHAKDAFSKTRTALVMEGYTDCVIAQQAGFGNAVAVLGTALGERHLSLLRRFVDRIVLVLDGDEAGRRRTDQILELFVAEQMDLRVLTLPDELDPCDFLLERGVEAFSQLVEQAVDALEHKFASALREADASGGMHAANRAVEEVLATLAKAPRLQASTSTAIKMREDQILYRLAARFGVTESRLRERLSELRRPRGKQPRETPVAVKQEEVGKLVLAEQWLLQILLQTPECLEEVRREISPTDFRCPRRRQLFATCCSLADAGEWLTFERLMLELEDPDLKGLLVLLDEQRQAIGSADRRQELADLLRAFREQQAVAQPVGQAADAERPIDEAGQMENLRRLVERERTRQGISLPTDG